MKKFKSLLFILLVSFVVMAFCFPAWGAKTIKIGVIGPMQFVQGKGHWNGAVDGGGGGQCSGAASRSARRK